MFNWPSQFDKLLEKATSNLMLEPDWPTIIQICDLIRQGDCPPKYALTSIKKKLQNPNPHISTFALSVLESVVKNCGHLIHDEIATREFMEDLKEIVKQTQAESVRQKILELLQIWASAFRSCSKYRAIQEVVTIMKAEGYKFPACKESDAMFSADTAPKWVNADVCHRCRVAFSVVVRKHHCRACGNVFCNQCTPKCSTLPKFGIEKEVRVCEACYEQNNKPRCTSPRVKHDAESLPAEYITSSLAQQSQIPKSKKTEEELKEEEDMQLALALSQSEAEAREKEKKKATTEIMNITTAKNKTSMTTNNDDEEDPELARYLNRSYWEKKQAEEKAVPNEKKLAGPDHYRISPAGPPSAPTTPTHQLENGEVTESELNEFVSFLKSQVEIFVNRMKSNSSRGRSISNDSSVQTLFMNVTKNHSTLLSYIHQQDDSRVYYEGLQDKLAQVKDAMMALDALREEHREKLRREAEEAERLRQLQMAQKLEIMRRRKQEYLQYQRQLAIQKVQEKEREMQMRQEQQKQQYLMGNMGIPQHVPWDGNMPPMQNPPIQYGQQFQPLPSGFIQTAGYAVPAPSASVTQAPNSVAVAGNVPPGMITTHPQVIPPHSGQIPMQHQEEQSRRAGGQILSQQQLQPPRLIGPQPSQGGSLPVSNQLPQVHSPQIPSTNYQGLPLSTILQILPQNRSLVMPTPGGPSPTLSANMNLPPASAPQNLTMPPVPPQVVGIKGRAPQNVVNPIPGQALGLPSGVVIPSPTQSISLFRGSQQRLPTGHPHNMTMPAPNIGMLQSANGTVNGQSNMMMPPSSSQSGISLQQTQPQPRPQQTQQTEDESDSKTGELISFD